jgi:hypothetical protein
MRSAPLPGLLYLGRAVLNREEDMKRALITLTAAAMLCAAAVPAAAGEPSGWNAGGHITLTGFPQLCLAASALKPGAAVRERSCSSGPEERWLLSRSPDGTGSAAVQDGEKMLYLAMAPGSRDAVLAGDEVTLRWQLLRNNHWRISLDGLALAGKEVSWPQEAQVQWRPWKTQGTIQTWELPPWTEQELDSPR